MKRSYCLIAAFTVLLSSPVFADHYKILVDAGSTGSRLHLFQYETSEKQVPVIHDIFSENVKPGLSSFEKNPQDAGKSLKKLLDDVSVELQKHQAQPQDVELEVLATAGMRLLPNDAQEAIYTNVKSFASTYRFKKVSAETISGKMEGLYGWLDINYLAENFQNHTPTVGSIDMGGASTQIAFATADMSRPDDTIKIKIVDLTYKVFSKSFLGLGQDQARDKINHEQNAAKCYPNGYELSQTSKGDFNFASCGELYTHLIEKNQVSESIISSNNQSFWAYSGAYYTFNFFEADKTPDRNVVEQRVLAECNKPWKQFQVDHPGVEAKYLSAYCANAMYMDDLFYDTYHLKNGRLAVVSKVKNKDIDWTLGAVLFELVNE